MEEACTAWKVVDSKVVLESPYFRLRSDLIELPDGTRIGDYYVRESRGFAVIFAVTPGERVVLVRQYKHGIGQSVLELPAGGIDPGETAAACAARELAEETGYVSGDPGLELLQSFIFDPTSATTRYHLYLARNALPLAPQKFDPLEDIAVELVTFGELRGLVRSGAIEVGVQAGAIYHTLDVLGRL